MNFKIATMLIVSVLMSANTSYGEGLLERMLGRAGCSSCAAPAAAKGCGCGGGGLLDKLMSGCSCKGKAAGILNVDSAAGCGCEAAAPSCGCEAAAPSCGCEVAPAVEASPCGCDAAPMVEASPCGCDAAPMVEASPCGCEGASVLEASPCGCEAAPAVAASPCGCEAAPAIEASPCGCDAAPAVQADGIIARLREWRSGCEAAPAIEASPCGCDAAPAVEASVSTFEASPAMANPFSCGAAPEKGSCGCGSDGGFLSRLRGMCKCGSDPAPAIAEASSCGCEAAPAVSACGCGAPAVSSSCGCDAAPAVSTCGCQAPCGGGCKSGGGFGGGSYQPGATRPKLTLLDRLKGNRVARDRDGKVIGVCNDGCNPPCPREPAAACGCGTYEEAPYVIEAAPCSSCSTCGGGEVIYSDGMPASGCANGMCGSTPIYGNAVALPAAAAAVSEGSGSRVDPVVPTDTQGALEAVEEAERRDITQPSVSDGEDDPIVDPGAFIRRPTNTMGS